MRLNLRFECGVESKGQMWRLNVGLNLKVRYESESWIIRGLNLGLNLTTECRALLPSLWKLVIKGGTKTSNTNTLSQPTCKALIFCTVQWFALFFRQGIEQLLLSATRGVLQHLGPFNPTFNPQKIQPSVLRLNPTFQPSEDSTFSP